MSLFTTELRRLVKRRFVRYMTLAGLLVLLAVVAGTFLTNEKIGRDQIAAAERTAEQEYQNNLRYTAEARQDCERAKAAGDQTDRYPADCADISDPPREAFQAEWYMPATFEFRKEFGETVTTLAAILALVGFVVGASFVGAEWSTGGMMNLLLWRPRRLQVLLTKLAALLAAMLALTVVSAAAWTAAFWAIGTMRGNTDGMTSGTWQSFALTGLRGAVLVLAAAAVGFAVASLGRHTALALGGAIGLIVVGQFGLGILLSMANVAFVEAWLLPTYLLAWMNKSITLENWNACNFSMGQCEPDTLELTWQHSSALIGVALVLSLGAAMWAMRSRDIT
ncbi:ABC transporter permease subunit [Solwaraspora sp. WMMD1047]|uniref:ABC transporter permease subunit n=1 Tax=Solwaraspora sp. WMMD1047 TaxID=3016102 RepID=UPI002416E07C|nr:ABC transporter permease subunit [Solwaraspora sp. WMMD1047]MDG4833717.1 ABC transporter permease subunit [Solwaraspora sp. WMMD1047]